MTVTFSDYTVSILRTMQVVVYFETLWALGKGGERHWLEAGHVARCYSTFQGCILHPIQKLRLRLVSHGNVEDSRPN